ncbi:hypothetical protein [Georgenia sp.]
MDRSGPEALAELGVPAAHIAPAAVDRTTAIMTFAAHLPRPVAAQLGPGKVVAVLGAAGPVRATCAQMAARAGDHTVEIVQVTGRPAPSGESKRQPPGRRRVSTPRSATRLCQDHAGKLMLLAVEAGRTEAEQETVLGILQVFAPDQVWVALDARADRQRLEAQLTDLPVHHVDALAGQHAEDARHPGVLLDLGVPLAWLDGLPATGVVWGYVLAEAGRRALADDDAPRGRATLAEPAERGAAPSTGSGVPATGSVDAPATGSDGAPATGSGAPATGEATEESTRAAPDDGTDGAEPTP